MATTDTSKTSPSAQRERDQQRQDQKQGQDKERDKDQSQDAYEQALRQPKKDPKAAEDEAAKKDQELRARATAAFEGMRAALDRQGSHWPGFQALSHANLTIFEEIVKALDSYDEEQEGGGKQKKEKGSKSSSSSSEQTQAYNPTGRPDVKS